MLDNYDLKKHFRYLGQDLIDEMLAVSVIKEFPKNTELIKEGQYVKVVPLILKGLVKVFTRQEDKELLLYYIQSDESCIMSFSACLKRGKSKIYAVTEEDSIIILVPSDKIAQWVIDYPTINQLFYQQFDLRYSELISTINHLLFDKLDKRLLDYLIDKTSLTGKNPIKISHKEIANDLGTAREVISRLIKKLENQQKLKQHYNSIEVFSA